MRAPAEAAPSARPRIGMLRAFGAVWGPGLLVMLADTDAGNIVAAADAGARWGYRLVALPLLLIPALALVQDLAARIGILGGRGFGDLVRERLGPPWRWIAAAALVAATLGSLVAEFTGLAGVGELFGVPRVATLGLAGLCLLGAVSAGHHRRVERIALAVGLFGLGSDGAPVRVASALCILGTAALARDRARPREPRHRRAGPGPRPTS